MKWDGVVPVADFSFIFGCSRLSSFSPGAYFVRFVRLAHPR